MATGKFQITPVACILFLPDSMAYTFWCIVDRMLEIRVEDYEVQSSFLSLGDRESLGKEVTYKLWPVQ